MFESVLFVDAQASAPADFCPICGSERYRPGKTCRRCERRNAMTMQELSESYLEAARPLRTRLRILRMMLKGARDPEEIWHLKRRIAELTPMLTEMNELADLTAHYYDRGITEVRSIPNSGYLGPRLPREIQLARVRRVIREELTELQRYTLEAYYFREESLEQIARDRAVNKSTVCRTLHRAEEKLRRYLKY